MGAFADLVEFNVIVLFIGAILLVIGILFTLKTIMIRRKKARESQKFGEEMFSVFVDKEIKSKSAPSQILASSPIYFVAGKKFQNGKRLLPESSRHYPNWKKFDRRLKTLVKKKQAVQS